MNSVSGDRFFQSSQMEFFRYISFEHPDRIADLLERNSLYFAYPKDFMRAGRPLQKN
jgi:hypothetical protein